MRKFYLSVPVLPAILIVKVPLDVIESVGKGKIKSLDQLAWASNFGIHSRGESDQ